MSATQAISKALRELLDRDAIKRKDLVNRTKKPSATVSRHLNGRFMPSPEDRAEYAQAFGMTPMEFESFWKRKRVEMEAATKPQPSGLRGQPRDVMQAEHYQSVSAARTEDRELVERKGKMPVARSGGRRQFVVTVDGDCQEPKYHSGDDVVFSVDALEQEGIRDGASYYIELKDGTTTFKRVFVHPDNRELLILQAWNPRYPQREIHRDEVQMMARCLGRWEPDVTG